MEKATWPHASQIVPGSSTTCSEATYRGYPQGSALSTDGELQNSLTVSLWVQMHALTESLSRISAKLAMRTVPQSILHNNIQVGKCCRNLTSQPLEFRPALLSLMYNQWFKVNSLVYYTGLIGWSLYSLWSGAQPWKGKRNSQASLF